MNRALAAQVAGVAETLAPVRSGGVDSYAGETLFCGLSQSQ